MPLTDFLPIVNEKLKADSRNKTLLSLQNALQSYSAAIGTPNTAKEDKQAPTVRSALGALTAVCSSEAAQQVLQSADLATLGATVRDEAGRWDNDKFKYNPARITPLEKLEGGKAGTTLAVTVAPTGAKKVFKPEPTGYGFNLDEPKDPRKVPDVPGEMNVDLIGSRLSGRAVASYKVDKALGCQVLARTRFAAATIKDGQALFGTLQDWTGGTSLNKLLSDDNQKQMLLEKYKNPEILKQLQHLQLVDYVTGQTDRHADNIHLTPDNKILGIDHDFSFGTGLLGTAPNFPAIKSTKNKGLPKFIDADLKNKILSMEPESLLGAIRPYLSTVECECTGKRFTALQTNLKEGKIKEVVDWQKDVSSADIESLIGKQSYLYEQAAK
jgi:hypothetical protein